MEPSDYSDLELFHYKQYADICFSFLKQQNFLYETYESRCVI